MTTRRLALRSPASLATFLLLFLTLVSYFAPPSTISRAEPVASDAAAPAHTARVAPGDMKTGALLLWSADGSLVEAPRLQTDVVMTVYPVLPLTVMPKPEAKPLGTPKAPDDVQRMAILALVLALLSATTLIVWRHHRRDYASPRRIGRRI